MTHSFGVTGLLGGSSSSIGRGGGRDGVRFSCLPVELAHRERDGLWDSDKYQPITPPTSPAPTVSKTLPNPEQSSLGRCDGDCDDDDLLGTGDGGGCS
jgi:hypothetical protein